MAALRILQLSNRIPYPLNDGGARGNYFFTRGYKDAGCAVTLLAMNTTRHYVAVKDIPQDIFEGITLISIPVDNRIKPMAALLNLFRRQSYNIQRFESEAYRKALMAVLTGNTFDIIHFDGLYVAPYLSLARQYSNATCVYREHNVESEIWERLAENATWAKSWYLRLLAGRLKRYESKVLNEFDLLLSISGEDEQKMKERGVKTPMHLTPFGVDFTRIPDYQGPVIPKSVFFIGSMEWMPNVEGLEWFLREIWPQVLAAESEARFYVAGKSMPEEMKRRAVQGVIFVGEVPDPYEFMQDKQLMVVPLLSGSGIRVKIIEALAMRKQVVSTPVGAEGIQVDGTGLQIAASPSLFGSLLIKLLGIPDQFVGDQSDQVATIYSQEKIIQNLILKYHKVTE